MRHINELWGAVWPKIKVLPVTLWTLIFPPGWFSKFTPVLNLVVVVAALTTVYQAQKALDNHETQMRYNRILEMQAMTNRFRAFALEIEGNLDVAARLIDKEDEYLRGDMHPQQVFLLSSIEHVVNSGLITEAILAKAKPDSVVDSTYTERGINATLIGAFHQLTLANQLIEKNLDLQVFAALGDLSDITMQRVNSRSIELKTLMMGSVHRIDSVLTLYQQPCKHIEDFLDKELKSLQRQHGDGGSIGFW